MTIARRKTKREKRKTKLGPAPSLKHLSIAIEKLRAALTDVSVRVWKCERQLFGPIPGPPARSGK